MRSFIFFLMLIPLVSGFEITEIMYDPEGNDNNKEYIELLTNGSSLEGTFFEDLAGRDALTLMQEGEGPYALIVEEGFDSTGVNATLYSVGATIGNNLNNDKDLVLFRDAAKILDAFLYVSKRDGGNNNGYALCRVEDIFVACAPTPGQQNILDPPEEEVNYTLALSEFLPDPEGDDSLPWPKGEWIELYNYGEKPLSLVGLQLFDQQNQSLTISAVHAFPPVLDAQQHGIIALQGKTLLNNQGFEELILRSKATVLDRVSYSFSEGGLSWSKEFVNGTFHLSLPTPGAPDDTGYLPLNSSLLLEHLNSSNATSVRFGDALHVRLTVYRGNSTSEHVTVSVTNISEPLTLAFDKRYREHTFTFALPLYANCQRLYPEGEYALVAEGLGIKTELPLRVQGIIPASCQPLYVVHNITSVCENSTNSTVHTRTSKQPSSAQSVTEKQRVRIHDLRSDGQYDEQQVLPSASPSLPDRSSLAADADTLINQESDVVYEASDHTAKRWAVYFFCFTLLLAIVVLLIYR